MIIYQYRAGIIGSNGLRGFNPGDSIALKQPLRNRDSSGKAIGISQPGRRSVGRNTMNHRTIADIIKYNALPGTVDDSHRHMIKSKQEIYRKDRQRRRFPVRKNRYHPPKSKPDRIRKPPEYTPIPHQQTPMRDCSIQRTQLFNAPTSPLSAAAASSARKGRGFSNNIMTATYIISDTNGITNKLVSRK